ncbi:MAG TPA: glycosyltransferase family 2 protein [Flavobacteriaceae bacterium]|nr:glycosyltransferase family 2 protein [Flavobacteriaceae bacterium]
MSFFSVVIPLFNKEAHIEATLNSVLNQSFADLPAGKAGFEIIIVNDGSTDKSLEKVKAINDKRIKIFSQENAGASIARNHGITKAENEHIALLDADDIWQPNHLEEHHKSIVKFPEAALYCTAYNLSLSPNFTHSASYSFSGKEQISIIPDYFEASMIHPIAMTSGVVFKKKDFIEIGSFNPKVLSGQDIDLWIRFGLKKQIVFNRTITTGYDKTIANSLSKGDFRKSKCALFNSYKSEEKVNLSLKKYLDLNRYSLAVQCKYSDDHKVLKILKENIDLNSLNFKQKIILFAPNSLVRSLKRFHSFLIKKNIYVTSFQ